jgi:hypothetical protein
MLLYLGTAEWLSGDLAMLAIAQRWPHESRWLRL